MVEDFINKLKKENWHVMIDNEGDLITCNKFGNMINTNKVDLMQIVNIEMQEEITKKLEQVKQEIKQKMNVRC